MDSNKNKENEINNEDNKPLLEREPAEHISLTQFELHGLKAIVMYLHSLPIRYFSHLRT